MLLTLLLNKWLDTGSLHTFLTPVLSRLVTLFNVFEQDGGLENMRLIDSVAHVSMTGDSRWFSSLTPVMTNEYITFGDNSRGKVQSVGTIKVNKKFVLKEIAKVDNLHFNLLSLSQLLDDGFEVCFKKGCSCVLYLSCGSCFSC
jgi:hypothetical protein